MAEITTTEFVARKVGIIVYMSVVNFMIIAYLSPPYANTFMFRYNPRNTRNASMVALLINVGLIAVFAYAMRSLSKTIPLPLAREGFDPKRVKEVKGSVLTAFSMFLFFGDYIRDFKTHLFC